MEHSKQTPLTLVTIGEAARLLACSEKHVRRLINGRHIAAIRDGRFIRLRLVDIATFIEARRIAPLAAGEVL